VGWWQPGRRWARWRACCTRRRRRRRRARRRTACSPSTCATSTSWSACARAARAPTFPAASASPASPCTSSPRPPPRPSSTGRPRHPSVRGGRPPPLHVRGAADVTLSLYNSLLSSFPVLAMKALFVWAKPVEVGTESVRIDSERVWPEDMQRAVARAAVVVHHHLALAGQVSSSAHGGGASPAAGPSPEEARGRARTVLHTIESGNRVRVTDVFEATRRNLPAEVGPWLVAAMDHAPPPFFCAGARARGAGPPPERVRAPVPAAARRQARRLEHSLCVVRRLRVCHRHVRRQL